ncbi:MAG: 3-deoxy-D-manno-octulosonic acid transferase [Hyphomonadaceae bacterium]|nr:3-deoxy-D-manno-octulosonic acid transferase [Hyphomonadaceae bacterium]
MSFSPVLGAYRAAVAVVGVFAGGWLSARARRGKEDADRLGERFGRYSSARPAGKLIWLHAASVGESGVALTLIDALAARDPALSFLISTGTRTSAELVARRAPPRTTHIYAPLDLHRAVRRFYDHWRPDAGVFVESELWPNLIVEAAARAIPLALVNARMSPRTLRRWKRWRAASRRLLQAFTWLSAADGRTASALSDVRGQSVPNLGNLKLAAPSPGVDAAAKASILAQIGERPLWLAASTHAGEDELVLKAHEELRTAYPSALLIIVPRHPERGAAVAALAGHAPRRSLGQPIGDAPVYIADTLGELGLFYDIAPVALVAGSLLAPLKGHNPIEPAKLGAAILTGPYVESFEDVYAALRAGQGATTVTDPETLAAAVAQLWRDGAARQQLTQNARAVVAQGANALDSAVMALASLIATETKPAHAPA